MVMSNGKTPAQNLEGLVGSNKNTKAKEAIIKKVVNWQEQNKTKPQEYAMYDEGTGKDGASRKTLFDQRGRNSTLGRWLRAYDAGQEERRSRAIQQFFDFVRNDFRLCRKQQKIIAE